MLIVWLPNPDRRPVFGLIIALAAFCLLSMGCIWAIVCHVPNRAPDLKWDDEGKWKEE